VLRRAAELAVVFAEAGAMDFTEVTRRAVRTLGDEAAATSLWRSTHGCGTC